MSLARYRNECVIINPNDVPTMPCGVGTTDVGFIDIIAFGTDKQACLYDMNKDNILYLKVTKIIVVLKITSTMSVL